MKAKKTKTSNPSKFKQIFIPTIALFLICGIVTGLLAVTNYVTTSEINKRNEEMANETRQVVYPNADSFKEVKVDIDNVSCFSALDSSGKIIGYTIGTEETGYGGTIKIMTGINLENNNIIKVDVYEASEETPGLGNKITENDFTNLFKGELPKNGFKINENIDSVTGATISSDAAVKAVNQALDIYNSVKESGSNE